MRRDSSIVRYARSKSSPERPSQRAADSSRASGLEASVEAFMWEKLYHPGGCYNPPLILTPRDIYRHEHPTGQASRTSPPLGRNRPRKSDRDDLAQDHHRRARNGHADLLEEGRRRADALARERTDDLRA